MKRKTFTKLVCIILCILTIFCSGCGDYIGNDPEKIQEFINTMQKRKEEAQTFIPQCTDYTLKITLDNIYTRKELIEKQGFYIYQEFFSYYPYEWYIKDFSEFRIMKRIVGDDGRSSWTIAFTISLDSIYKHNFFYFEVEGGGELSNLTTVSF